MKVNDTAVYIGFDPIKRGQRFTVKEDRGDGWFYIANATTAGKARGRDLALVGTAEANEAERSIGAFRA